MAYLDHYKKSLRSIERAVSELRHAQAMVPNVRAEKLIKDLLNLDTELGKEYVLIFSTQDTNHDSGTE